MTNLLSSILWSSSIHERTTHVVISKQDYDNLLEELDEDPVRKQIFIESHKIDLKQIILADNIEPGSVIRLSESQYLVDSERRRYSLGNSAKAAKRATDCLASALSKWTAVLALILLPLLISSQVKINGITYITDTIYTTNSFRVQYQQINDTIQIDQLLERLNQELEFLNDELILIAEEDKRIKKEITAIEKKIQILEKEKSDKKIK